MTATRTLRIIALAAGSAVWLVAAALLWRTAVPSDLDLPTVSPSALFRPAVLDETGDYARVLRVLWLAALAAQLALLGALALRGPAIAARIPGGWLRRGLLLLLLALTGLWLVERPFALAAHWWRRRHDVSRQGYVDWLVAPWLELVLSVLLACAGVALAMLLARRLGSRWWVAGAPLLAVLGAAAVLVQPLVFVPRFQPLEDRALAAEIDRLAERMGVEGVEVRVRRVHDRTRRANASLHGIGPTRRLILWDTLLDGRFTRDEVAFVAAHELAHAERRHLWKGLAWFALLTPLLTLALARATSLRGGIAEPGAVPLAVLAALVLQLALLPVTNVLSRRYEAEADWIALEASRDPAAARGFFRRLPATNLAQPLAPRWARVLLGTHPPLVERIAMTLAWQRREQTLPARDASAGRYAAVTGTVPVKKLSRRPAGAPGGSGSPRGSTTASMRPPSPP
jgi:STE24 endopeptidase